MSILQNTFVSTFVDVLKFSYNGGRPSTPIVKVTFSQMG